MFDVRETFSDLNPMFDHVIKMCKYFGTPRKKIQPDFVILLLVMKWDPPAIYLVISGLDPDP